MKGTDKLNLNMFKMLCGPESLSSVVLATTMWNGLPEGEGERRQKQLSETHWASMIEAKSRVMRHDNTKESALKIVDHVIAQRRRITLQIQTQLVKEGRTVEDTDAGRELKSKVLEEKKKAQERLRRAQEGLEQALLEQEEESATELLDKQMKEEAKIQAKDEELKSMGIKIEELMAQKTKAWEEAEAERTRNRKLTEARLEEAMKQLESLQERRKEIEEDGKSMSSDRTGGDSEQSEIIAQQDALLKIEIERYEMQLQMQKLREQQTLQSQQAQRQQEQNQLQLRQQQQQNEMQLQLQQQAQQFQLQQQAQQFQLQQRPQQSAMDDRGWQMMQMQLAQMQHFEEERRHKQNMSMSKRSLAVSAVGSAAGVAALAGVTICNVM